MSHLAHLFNAPIIEASSSLVRAPPGPEPCTNGWLVFELIRLLKAKQELVGVTADRRVEHIFGVIIVLVCKN